MYSNIFNVHKNWFKNSENLPRSVLACVLFRLTRKIDFSILLWLQDVLLLEEDCCLAYREKCCQCKNDSVSLQMARIQRQKTFAVAQAPEFSTVAFAALRCTPFGWT